MLENGDQEKKMETEIDDDGGVEQCVGDRNPEKKAYRK